jgi:hypothetical protein
MDPVLLILYRDGDVLSRVWMTPDGSIILQDIQPEHRELFEPILRAGNAGPD